MEKCFRDRLEKDIISAIGNNAKSQSLSNHIEVIIALSESFDRTLKNIQRAMDKGMYDLVMVLCEHLIEVYPDYPDIEKIKSLHAKALSYCPLKIENNSKNRQTTYSKGFMTLIINQ